MANRVHPEVQVIDRYNYLLPDEAECQWWESAWNVAWWFDFIGYTLIAVGAALLVGLTVPAYLSVASVVAALGLYPALQLADHCVAKARHYHALGEIEHGVAQELEIFAQLDAVMIDGHRVTRDLFPVLARYFYYSGERTRLRDAANEVLARPLIPGEWPENRREQYQEQLDAMPAHQQQMFERERQKANRFEAFQLEEQSLRAKVEAANFHATLCIPERQHIHLRHLVLFSKSDVGSTVNRLATRALATIYPGANAPNDPFMLSLGGQRTFSFDEIRDMPENDLSNFFQQPQIVVPPAAEVFARR